MKQNDTKEEDKLYTKFDKQLGDFFLKIYKEIGIAGTVLVIIILLIGFIWLISQEPIQCLTFDIAASHNVGDAMGGMLSPVIGLIAVVLTFCAFYVQYVFNKKQLDFYENDKIDKLIEEYNNLIISIIKNDSKLFVSNYSIPTPIFRESFILIFKDYKENSITTEKIMTLINVNFLKAYKQEEAEEAEKIKNLDKKVKKFILGSIMELNIFRNLLYSFLSEIDKYTYKKEDKIEIIISFLIKYSILNKNSNQHLTYLIITHFDALDVGIKTNSTNEHKTIIKEALKKWMRKEPSESIKCLDYVANNLI